MNNIQITDSEARSIRSLFNTNGWETYMAVVRNARGKARDEVEAGIRDDKTRQAQGASLALKEICKIEDHIRNILQDDNN